MKKNMQKRLLMITLTLIFAVVISGAVSAADNPTDNQTTTNISTNDSNIPTNSSQQDSVQENSQNQTLPDPRIEHNGVIGSTVYATIQDAINAAQAGDTIWLEDGGTFSTGQWWRPAVVEVTKNLSFRVFNGGTATIDGTNNRRAVYIDSGVTANFYNIIITNGRSLNPSLYDGAGIFNDNGAVNLYNCILDNNDGLWSGGGIYNNHGTVRLENSIIRNNDVPTEGGGIYNNQGTVNIVGGSSISSNSARNGGGIYNNQGTVTIDNSNVNGNSATGTGNNYGGAIYNDNGMLSIYESNIMNNRADNDGGAIYNTGTTTITSSELYSNTVGNGDTGAQGGNGGAIYNTNTGNMTISSSKLYSNAAGNGGNGADGSDSSTGTGGSGNPGGAGGNGGAIYNQGYLSISETEIYSNKAGNGGKGGDGGDGADRGYFIVNLGGPGGAGGAGGSGGNGGAIYNTGTSTLIITDSDLSDNEAGDGGVGGIGGQGGDAKSNNPNRGSGYAGGAGGAGGTGGAGGAIYYNAGTTGTITNSNFTNNEAGTGGLGGLGGNGGASAGSQSGGAGGRGGNFGNGGNGGAIYFNSGSLTVTSNNLIQNNAGAAATPYENGGRANNGSGTQASRGNSGSNGTGGAFYAASSTSLHFNRILSNGLPDVASSGVNVNAENNWWGTNFEGTNPLAAGRITSNVDANPWLILSITASPSSIYNGQTSTVTADLNHNWDGGSNIQDVSALGHVPDGIPVNFSFQGAPLGTLDINPAYTNNGVATTTFTANAAGTSHVMATVDSQTVGSADIQINPIAELNISKSVDNVSHPGHTINYQDNINYTITVNNTGLDPAENVVITDTISNLLNFDPTSVTSNVAFTYNWDNVNRIFTAYLTNPLNNGTTAYLYLPAQVLAHNQTVDNTANVTTATYDPTTPDETNLSFYVPPAADIAVNKTVNNKTPNVLDTIIYTITVRNNGPDQATNVLVNDMLPAGLTFDHYAYVDSLGSEGYFDWNSTTRTFTVNGFYFDPNGYVTVDLYAIVNAILGGQHVDNTASLVSLDQYDWNTTNNATTVGIDVNPAADLSVSKDVDYNNPDIGQMIMYTIRVYNNLFSPNDATGVTVTDDLPDGVIFDHASSPDYNPYTNTWNVGSLLRGEEKILYIWAIVNAHPTSPSYTNTAYVSGNQYDWNPSNNYESETINVPVADIAVTKTVNDSTPNVLDTIIYTITVRNNGPDQATNVNVDDVLPTGLTYDHYTVTGSSGFTGSPIWNSGTGTLTINGAFNPHGYVTVDLYAIVNTILGGQHVDNTAAKTAEDQYDPDTSNDSSTIGIDVNAASDIAVNKTIIDLTPNSGINYNDFVLFTLTARNNGPNDASGVVVTDYLPNGFNYWFATTFKGTYTVLNNVVTWTVGTLNSGQTAYLWITGRINGTGWMTNNANLTNVDQYDWNSSNNNTSLSFYVNPAADIAVTKSYDNYNNPGQTVNYHDYIDFTVTATNNGPDDATGVVIRDDLPSGIIFDHATGGSYTYDSANRRVIWNVGSLAANTSTQLHIIAYVNDTGLKDNVARVIASNQFDWNILNNRYDLVFIIPPAADLSITKSVNDTHPAIGETLNYTITVTNNGPDNAKNIVVQDTIPVGLTYVGNDRGATWNATTRVLTWIIPNSHWSWFDGWYGLSSGNNITMHVYVTVDANSQVPSITNTANVTGTRYDWNMTNNQDSETIYEPVADIQLTKNTSNSTPNVGQQFTYTITATNSGPQTATNVFVSDLIPSGLTINSVSFTGSGSQSYDWNTGVWWIESILSGNSAQLIITVTPTASVAGTNVTNNATKTAEDQYDPTIPDTASVTVYVPSVDIAINKTVSNGTPNYLDNVIWAINVTNNGPDNATNIVISDVYDLGLNVLNIIVNKGIFNSTTGLWTIGSLAPGESTFMLIFTQIMNSNTTLNNTASLYSVDQYDWNSTNNNSTASVIVPPASNVYIITSAAPTNLTVGGTTVITVKVGNNGPDSANNVIVSYTVPSGFEYVGMTQEAGYPTPVYNPATRTVTWNLGTLDVIDPYMYITLRAISPGIFDNIANVTTTTYDPNTGNKTSSVIVNVQQPVVPNVNAASSTSRTVGMLPTGLPLAGLVLAILAVFGGLVMPKRKN